MKLTYALIIAVLIAAVATPVSADAPEFFSFPETGQMEFDCGTYTVMYEWEGTDTFIAKWDQGFVNSHHFLEDAFYRTDGVGQTYTHVEQNSLRYDLDQNEIIFHGLFFHMVIPHHGSVLIISGTYVLDGETEEIIYYHGNPDKNNVDPDTVCEAFAED
jgi:hypothetical protein